MGWWAAKEDVAGYEEVDDKGPGPGLVRDIIDI